MPKKTAVESSLPVYQFPKGDHDLILHKNTGYLFEDTGHHYEDEDRNFSEQFLQDRSASVCEGLPSAYISHQFVTKFSTSTGMVYPVKSGCKVG